MENKSITFSEPGSMFLMMSGLMLTCFRRQWWCRNCHSLKARDSFVSFIPFTFHFRFPLVRGGVSMVTHVHSLLIPLPMLVATCLGSAHLAVDLNCSLPSGRPEDRGSAHTSYSISKGELRCRTDAC